MKNQLQARLQTLLSGLEPGTDGIWSCVIPAGNQEAERKMREQVAAEHQVDYLGHLAKHHSIPVMDREVGRFLDNLAHDAIIIDVGGCWGWHWRKLLEQRPDVCVVIVDFVRNNLHHAQNILGALVGTRIALVHADATALPFPDQTFDGFWTVQTFQHIPDFQQACREAHRVLRNGGRFENYSLHTTPVVRFIFRLFGRPYHQEGMVKGLFHLSRANDGQMHILSEIFGEKAKSRYTECLFHPDIKLTFTGKVGSWLGQLDARLGDFPILGRRVARQRSFEVIKPYIQDGIPPNAGKRE